MKEKNIQIPMSLFMELFKFFELDMEIDYDMVKRELNTKLESLALHENYTKYKTAPTAEEKEAARQKYLDTRGIHPSYRW